jgi:hypothetical protein
MSPSLTRGAARRGPSGPRDRGSHRRDHVEQVARAAEEHEILPARGARLGHVRVPGHHRDRRRGLDAVALAADAPTNGHRAQPGGRVLGPVRVLRDVPDPLHVRLVNDRGPGVGGAHADHVVRERGRRPARPGMRDGGIPAIGRGQPEDQIGQRHVGDHLPVADQRVQPVEVLGQQPGVLLREFREGRHPASLRVRLYARRPADDAAHGGRRAPSRPVPTGRRQLSTGFSTAAARSAASPRIACTQRFMTGRTPHRREEGDPMPHHQREHPRWRRPEDEERFVRQLLRLFQAVHEVDAGCARCSSSPAGSRRTRC